MSAARGFTVAHQTFFVDVDLDTRSLSGWTKLTIVPTTASLTEVILDARRLRVGSTAVNGEPAKFEYKDRLTNPPSCPRSWGVSQFHLLKDKMRPLFHGEISGPGELVVQLPENARPTKILGGANATDFDPLTIRVEFEVSGDATRGDGLHFVGGIDSGLPRSQWHVYTTHTPMGLATSSWLPCVDGLWSRNTWEMEFSVPRAISLTESREDDVDMDADSEIDEEDAEGADFLVVSSSVAPTIALHSSDPDKKVVRFEMFSPVSSQHIGFAAGPFVPTALVTVDEQAQAQALAQAQQAAESSVSAAPPMPMPPPSLAISLAPNPRAASSGTTEDKSKTGPSVAMTVYALRDQTSMVAHCTKVFVRAMDYFSREFGSYPFESWSLCFVSQLPFDEVDAAGLTIVSDSLLFPPNYIEPQFENLEPSVRGLAAQWSGVNLVPATWRDLWITEGVAGFMTHRFVRRLMGNNEFQYRMRKYSDLIVQEDVERPPLGFPEWQFPLNVSDMWFTRLKAPMVLFILNQRMTKTDRNLGLNRALSKLFLQGMSGDVQRSQVSSTHFIRTCEKVGHTRLTSFFDQWVWGSGYPIFRVTQRFNKKRMFIEMGIGQVQSRELPPETLRNETFLEQAVSSVLDGQQYPAVPTFTGSMTIRIHEADGTPYEHVVDLRDPFTKLDIQYNTKYKRLKRTQKFRSGYGRTDILDGAPGGIGGGGGGFISCLGDVLMRDIDIDRWQLSDWGENDEDLFNEAFEWMRVDADFEWLGRIFVGQPDYMYASQLQQDRDVVAQLESVKFFASQPPNPIYSTILVRTLMDRRYFYGVRVAAALGLSQFAVDSLRYLGRTHLRRAFQELFCFPGTLVPRANNFSDFASYFIQKAIPRALSSVRDPQGRCPADCARFVLDLVRYNENSGNPYSDAHYMASLIESIVWSLRSLDPEDLTGGLVAELDEAPVRAFVEGVSSEIDKCQRLDRWLPSWHHIVTTTALDQDEVLVRAGYGQPRMDRLLEATRSSAKWVRLTAFQSLLNLGGYRTPSVLKYVFMTARYDPDPEIRLGVLRMFARMLGDVARRGEYFAPTDRAAHVDESPIVARQRALARRSVATVVPLVREAMNKVDGLREHLWEALTEPSSTLAERRLLFELCTVLFEPVTSLIAKMKTPPLYRLSIKRRSNPDRDFLMVVRYRSVLKKKSHGLGTISATPELEPESEVGPDEEVDQRNGTESANGKVEQNDPSFSNASKASESTFDESIAGTAGDYIDNGNTCSKIDSVTALPKIRLKLG